MRVALDRELASLQKACWLARLRETGPTGGFVQGQILAPAAVRDIDLVSRVWPESDAQKPEVDKNPSHLAHDNNNEELQRQALQAL